MKFENETRNLIFPLAYELIRILILWDQQLVTNFMCFPCSFSKFEVIKTVLNGLLWFMSFVYQYLDEPTFALIGN